MSISSLITAPLRIDKWLYYARFFKTRGMATRFITSGKLRLDGQIMSKPHRTVQIGHTLTFSQIDRIKVIRIERFGTRRGPASEAAELYLDLSPSEDGPHRKDSNFRTKFENRHRGAGRPTKKDARRTQALKNQLY